MHDVEACVKTLLRAERDGRFGGGELNADAVQASSILTLKLDWRRVHARLSCSSNTRRPRDVLPLGECHVGPFVVGRRKSLLEHCDAGALWPFRNQLLRRLDASTQPEGPSRLVRTLLETSRYARRCLGHGACEADAIQLESDSKSLAEAVLDRFASCVQGCLTNITKS